MPDMNTPLPESSPTAPGPSNSVTVSGMGGPAQPQVSPTPVDQQIQQGAQPQPMDVSGMAQIAHHTKMGAFWNALNPTHTVFAPDPNNPSGPPVAQQIKDKPGQLFRSILAGALMGAGAGNEGNPQGGFVGHMAGGAAAASQGMQQRQQQAQQQAQQQWQNQLAQKKEAREETAADTENTVRKAQIARANAETLRTNILTQGTSFENHQRIADADKSRISTYTSAGLKPRLENVSESEMKDYFEKNPGASTLDWRHTGVITTVDKDGEPHYEYTLSAYDPKEAVPVSQGTIDQWKKDGLFKYHPEYADQVKAGKKITVGQFASMDQDAQNISNKDYTKNKADLELKELQGHIEEAKAAAHAHNTTASEANLNIEEKRVKLAADKEENAAWDALAKVGNDPDKLTDAHMRTVLARSVRPLMMETRDAIKQAAADNDTAEQKELWGKYNAYQKLASLAPAGSGQVSPVTFINPQGQQVVATTQDQIDKATKLGYKKQGEAVPHESLSPMGRAAVGAVKASAPYIQTGLNLVP